MKNNPFFNKISYLFRLIKEGNLSRIWEAFSTRIYSEWLSFGYRRDLHAEVKKPRTLLNLDVRPSIPSDEPYFKENYKDGLINQFKTCYVGTTKDGDPCCRLWIIDSSQNQMLQKDWKDIFPLLKPNEVLFENLYTIPKYRGLGAMPFFMDSLCDIAKEMNADYAITFSAVKNLTTIRTYSYAGFRPYILRRKKWFLFKRTITFEPIPENLIEYYNQIVNKRLKSRN